MMKDFGDYLIDNKKETGGQTINFAMQDMLNDHAKEIEELKATLKGLMEVTKS